MAMAASRQGSANAVRLLLTPSPSNLLESREILRICQSFGEVTTFKHLKYHELNPAPNSALAVFQRPESAQALVKASPVSFTLETQLESYDDDDSQTTEEFPEDIAQQSSTRKDARELHAPNNLLGPSSPPLQLTKSKPPSQNAKSRKVELKDIRLIAEYWRGNQQDFLERSPLWGAFEVHTDNAVQQDLARRVPLIGLSDIYVPKREVPLRVLRKRQEELNTRKSWGQIWEEGKRERGEIGAADSKGASQIDGGDALSELGGSKGPWRGH